MKSNKNGFDNLSYRRANKHTPKPPAEWIRLYRVTWQRFPTWRELVWQFEDVDHHELKRIYQEAKVQRNVVHGRQAV